MRSLLALAVGLLLVVFCYYFVDRPVAFYVSRHHLNDYEVFKWLTYPPPWVQAWSPLVIAVLVLRGSFATRARWEKALLVACVSVILADQFRESIGDVCGRYWPETWHNNNPSLIGTGTYGFHAFELGAEEWKPGDDTGSFPSGHATRIAAFAAVFWIAYRNTAVRALLLIATLSMLASLVLMNYHFVGDVAGGLFIGTLVAAWASYFAKLTMGSTPQVGSKPTALGPAAS